MKSPVRGAIAVTLLVIAANASAELSDLPSGDYRFDKSHTYISFIYDHYGFSEPIAGFKSFDASLVFDGDDPDNSSVHVVIDAASVDTRVASLDKMLNSARFFDTDKFPQATFRSTSFVRTGEDTFDVIGDLTIKDITVSVTLATTIRTATLHPRRNIPAIGMLGEATVKRSDWGMTFDSPGVPDEVKIQITAEMLQIKTD